MDIIISCLEERIPEIEKCWTPFFDYSKLSASQNQKHSQTPKTPDAMFEVMMIYAKKNFALAYLVNTHNRDNRISRFSLLCASILRSIGDIAHSLSNLFIML